ncbi:NUDIX hydrolase [Xanthomonas phaseoli]|uniref:Phosphatase NudJ n=2 Tax=Xanthomonas TaxID=338 RepID=A0A8I1XIK4_XANMN|nr:NUDIX hydrolase [Xanthomonas phaseoli]MBO9721200.1 NUDIX hydrolase [Xanthomonas phaseoli pv. manihotis]MBO9756213.1 NUDIX hydrolase [Xanthomonas phaseoli pv. manihotis]MBO9758703.1 NUDIX hydrolase [Xanthomonas phaseoli pv. manihotis]MBO9763009.1 NUDIX hydrolase [Xanthomonas phaseoli pv. manihotis]MBO9782646.1 NUDIX hydrolase [Xanthomonas phaseoli pv. manihotis]
MTDPMTAQLLAPSSTADALMRTVHDGAVVPGWYRSAGYVARTAHRWAYRAGADSMSTPEQRWHPDVTVATVVARDGRFLQVEEAIGGRLLLNQPAGHLEPNESLQDAAVRETLEEAGWDVRLTQFIGTYQWVAANGQCFLRFAFVADALTHHPERSLDTGVVRALWMTPDELRASTERLRSPLVWEVVADYLAGQRHPPSLVRHIA